jgi:RimJ/RimL family protein N-acetyltransferase
MSERLHSERLIMHRLSASDLDAWLAGDREALESSTSGRFPARFEGPPSFVEHMEEIRDRLRQHEDDPAWSSWLMLARANNAAVGVAGFRRTGDVVTTRYSIYPALQHVGLATEGLQALLEWLFEQAEVNRVRATMPAGNAPSVRVAEKLGMELVREEEDLKAGTLLVYELFRSDPT